MDSLKLTRPISFLSRADALSAIKNMDMDVRHKMEGYAELKNVFEAQETSQETTMKWRIVGMMPGSWQWDWSPNSDNEIARVAVYFFERRVGEREIKGIGLHIKDSDCWDMAERWLRYGGKDPCAIMYRKVIGKEYYVHPDGSYHSDPDDLQD